MKMHYLLPLVLSLNVTWATSFFIQPFSDFTRTTPNIVRGTIQSTYVDHSSNQNGEKEIYTYAEVNLKEVIKGSIEGSRITIRKLGGTKDGITLEIPSSVEFKVGVESVFFLSASQPDRSYEVSGMELGRFDLVRENGKEVLKGGLFLYSQPHSKEETHFMAENIKENKKPWSFDQLKDLVAQQSLPPLSAASSPVIDKNQISSINQEVKPLASPSQGHHSSPHPEPVILTQVDKTPLYFEPTLWYTLAILVLTMGAIKYMRRE